MSLGRIFGTEEDKRNCAFYFKIGACRHGEGCSRLHNRPNFSPTILIPNMYQPPQPQANGVSEDPKEHFADFCDDILSELKNHGHVEELNVCNNMGEHLFGNVYIKFNDEEEAERALDALKGRYYRGRMLKVEYSPVTDFSESKCRQFEQSHCDRGAFCNFMHCHPPPDHLRQYFQQMRMRSRHAAVRSRSTGRRNSRDSEYDEIRIRNDSPERRALIAKWNREREANLYKEAKRSEQLISPMQRSR